MKLSKYISVFILLFLITTMINGQNEPPRLSPKATVSQVVGYTEISIVYSRPGVKDREIWGGLVPFNEVWRTGANEATTIEFSDDVVIEGNKVPKGKYGLFTIPGEKEWTIVLNKTWDQWGAFNYNEAEDLLRFNVKPAKSDFTPRLLFTFEYASPYSSKIVMKWDKLSIAFLVETK
jgi:hypothetical protein